MVSPNDVVDFNGSIGRVCLPKETGFWCVIFPGNRCLRVHESHLTPAQGDPPSCANCPGC